MVEIKCELNGETLDSYSEICACAFLSSCVGRVTAEGTENLAAADAGIAATVDEIADVSICVGLM